MKIGSTYKIVVDINSRVLTFTGRITSEDERFISFIDRDGKLLTYNKDKIISFEEVEE